MDGPSELDIDSLLVQHSPRQPPALWPGHSVELQQLPSSSGCFEQAAPPASRIPGPAGRGPSGVGRQPGGGGERGGGTGDPDFFSQPWLTALSCLDLEEFDESHPLLQNRTVRTAAGFAKSGKLSRLLAMVVAVQRTFSGQAFVRLKDPTGAIGGTVSKEALEAEPGIQPGSVLILDKVTVLRLPSLRPLHHVCVTLENIAQVIPAAPRAAQPLPSSLAAAAQRSAGLLVPLLPAPPPHRPPPAESWAQLGGGGGSSSIGGGIGASPALASSNSMNSHAAVQRPVTGGGSRGGWNLGGSAGSGPAKPALSQEQQMVHGQRGGPPVPAASFNSRLGPTLSQGQPWQARSFGGGPLQQQQPAYSNTLSQGPSAVQQSQMLPPPPRLGQGASSQSVAQQVPQASHGGNPAPLAVTQRGAVWLQGLLQELPSSDEFGCSQQLDQAEPAVPGAKRARLDQGAGEPVFGDGIDELMAGLDEEFQL